jgi:hypothetical protein
LGAYGTSYLRGFRILGTPPTPHALVLEGCIKFNFKKKKVIHETNNCTCCELGGGRPWPGPNPNHNDSLGVSLEVARAFPPVVTPMWW